MATAGIRSRAPSQRRGRRPQVIAIPPITAAAIEHRLIQLIRRWRTNCSGSCAELPAGMAHSHYGARITARNSARSGLLYSVLTAGFAKSQALLDQRLDQLLELVRQLAEPWSHSGLTARGCRMAAWSPGALAAATRKWAHRQSQQLGAESMIIILFSRMAMAATARLKGTRLQIKHEQFTIRWPPALTMGAAIFALTQPSHSIADTPNPDFGRYSERLVSCKMSANGSRKPLRPCAQLRIQQHLDGLISVRFSLGDAGRYSNESIVFAGLVSKGSQSMFCSSDGRCKPRLPLILEVNAISTAIFDGNGLGLTLPLGRVARGSCRIEPLRAQCQATALDGASWRADGYFPVLPPPAT